jgi:hypothetical protein
MMWEAAFVDKFGVKSGHFHAETKTAIGFESSTAQEQVTSVIVSAVHRNVG